MPIMDGSNTSFRAWKSRWRGTVAALAVALATTAFASPDNAKSTVSLEIRAWSLVTPRQDDIVLGSSTAPVTIVAFTDFHCPYCKIMQPTLQSLLAHYGDRIRLVHKDFPISRRHPQSLRAHEAARCAMEQDGFWAYHDKLMASTSSGETEQLMAYARETGLDDERLRLCLESGHHAQSVRQDIEEGIRLGVSGTPTFFINGRILRGAHPLESFMSRIDAELMRHATTNTSLTSHPAESTSTSP